MNRLDGRVAIVTGAGQGIGRGIALCLARAGTQMVVNDVVQERIAQTVSVIEALGVPALGVLANVTHAAEVDRLVQDTLHCFGKLDILVNNAGTVLHKSMLDHTEADWDLTLAVNLKSVFLCCHRVLREMIPQQHGAIVNIASMAAFHFTIPHVPYAAAKAGVVALTRDLAYEMVRYGVRVNAIASGGIDTPLMDLGLSPQQKQDKEAFGRTFPLGRTGRPEDIGEAVVFLVSDAASFITGETLPICGGMDLRVSSRADSK